LIWWHHSNE